VGNPGEGLVSKFKQTELTLTDLLRNGPHALEIVGRGDRKACLNDVHTCIEAIGAVVLEAEMPARLAAAHA